MFTIITNYKKLFLLTLKSELNGGEIPSGLTDKNSNKTTLDEALNKMKSSKTFDVRILQKIKDKFETEKNKLNEDSKIQIEKLLREVNNIIFNKAKEYYKQLGTNKTKELKKELNSVLGSGNKLDEKSNNILLKEYNIIVDFQKNNDIQIDGIIGSLTKSKINELKKAPASEPEKVESQKIIDKAISDNEKKLNEQIDGMKKIIGDYLKDNNYKEVDLSKLKDDDVKKINEIIIKIQSKQLKENSLVDEFKKLGIVLEKEVLEEVQVPEMKTAEKVASAPVEKTKLSPEQAEREYNERLDEALSPNTHTFFNLGGEVLVMEKNSEIEKMLLGLEKMSADDTGAGDKVAVYTVINYINNNKNKIKTVSKIFEEVGKDLSGKQGIIMEGKNKDIALLSTYFSKNSQFNDVKKINVIEVDIGNSLGNAILNSIPLVDVDTANVSQESLKIQGGKKATSDDFYYGYTEKINTGNGDIENTKIKPLERNELEKVLDNLADEIEKIFKDRKIDDKEILTPAGKLAQSYIKSLTQAVADYTQLPGVPEFISDDEIKTWLKQKDGENYKNIKDIKGNDIFPKEKGITISKNGFISFNKEELEKESSYIKLELEGVGKKLEKKEVYMEKKLIPFGNIGIDGTALNEISDGNPIVLEQDGTFLQITNKGLYIIGEGAKQSFDKTVDFIKKNKTIVAGIVGGIIGGLIVKRPHLNLSINLPHFHTPDLDFSAKHFGDSIDKLIKAFDKFGGGLAVGYFIASLPLEYKIENLEKKYSSLVGEKIVDNIMEYDDNYGKTIEEIENITTLKPNEKKGRINELMHSKFTGKMFDKGLGAGIDLTNIYKNDNGTYILKIKGKGNDIESRFVKDGEAYYIPKGQTLQITFDKNFDIINTGGKIKKEVTGFDKDIESIDLFMEEVPLESIPKE